MQPKTRTDYTTIALAYLSFISLGLYAGLLGLAWPSMQVEFGVPLASQGLLLLGATISALVVSFYSGPLTARLGIGRMLVIGGVLITLGLLAIVFNMAWVVMIVIMMVIGLGVGMIDAVINAYAAQNYSARNMNWLHACFGVGVTITPLIMTAIFSAQLSWRTGYAVVSAFVAVMTVLFFLTRAKWRILPSSEVEAAAPIERPSMLETLRTPIVWVGIGMTFLCAGLETAPGNWIFTLFTQGRGIDEVSAAQWVSVYWGSFTIGRIFFGAIISRVNISIMMRLCMIGTLIGAGLLWWNVAPWVGFAGLTLLGFAQAPVYPVLTSTTPERVGRRHAANAIGFQVAGAGAGLSLLPAFTGLVAERSTLEVIPPIIFVCIILLLALYQTSVVYNARHQRQVGVAVGAE